MTLARRRSRPLRAERLEGRSLMNASIDVAADGSLVYRSDPAAVQSLIVSRAGDVYTFAVGPADAPIVVASNAAGLTSTGSGTATVTVARPKSLEVVAASDGQAIRVRSTAVPTRIDLKADGATVTLGDDSGASGGLRPLAVPVVVVAAAGAKGNGLVVSDESAEYDPAGSLTYNISATAIWADGEAAFGGVSYSGLASVKLQGTRNVEAPAALYLVRGTADGVATTIDGTAGRGRDFSIVGMSWDLSSRLALLSAGEAHVWAASITSPTVVAGGSRTGVWVESESWVDPVRDRINGLNSRLVIDAAAGGVDLNVGRFWRPNPSASDSRWTLSTGLEGPAPYSRLRDPAFDRGEGSLYFRADQVRKLTVDDRGGGASTMRVDVSNGVPIPSADSAPGLGLAYFGGAGRSATSISLVGTPPSGAFADERHLALPSYGGEIALTGADGSKWYVSYALKVGADFITLIPPYVEDELGATSYTWSSDFYGLYPSTIAASNLQVGSTYGPDPGLSLSESNADLKLPWMSVVGKADVRILRGWAPGATTTTLEYRRSEPPAGLRSLAIENGTPGRTGGQLVRLVAAPRGVAVSASQGPGDSAVVALAGIAPAASVAMQGADEGDVSRGSLYVDATGVALSDSDLIDLGDGWVRIPPASAGSAAVTYRRTPRLP